jgi:hypothetical protein
MSGRPETGTMKFGDDWSGVFLRGDDAFGYANALEQLLKTASGDILMNATLGGLLDVLKSSDERFADKAKAQTLKPFDQCLKK